VLGDDTYKEMAAGIVRCLRETFAIDDLFATAFDADTEHHEGSTYVWRYDEIKAALSNEELERLAGSYRLPKEGNFEGAIHLTRTDDRPLQDIEEKLLALRRQRPQPFRDEKILCGVNALAASAMAQAARLLDRPELEENAARIVKRLLEIFWDGYHLAHSLADGTVQRQSFLSDAAALLLAVTMLRESDDRWAETMNTLARYVAAFKREGRWIESDQADFQIVAASWFDHPVPSAVSLAVMGLARAAVLDRLPLERLELLQPLQSDFFNVAAMIGGGHFHLIHSMKPIAWGSLPANSIQVRAETESDCYMNECRPLAY
jgi:hypothetical protein